MDTNAFPFDDVFFGDIEVGESVDTCLVMYQSLGQLYLIFGLDGDLEREYEVRWKID